MTEERVQRRLAAILAADVVGYSRLMGTDEVGTLSRLKQSLADVVKPQVAAHSGRIFKLMGDGALIEFASAVDAVVCAVEIQNKIAERNAQLPEERRILYRIGINVGDVIIEGDDVYGDGVNVAARVEALADPGGIYISRTARDQVRDRIPINIEDRGEQNLKNIARPIHVFSVILGGDGAVIVEEDGAAASTAAAAAKSPVAPIVPDKPSIAVLAFDNMSDDPDQAYFSDGIGEDIITDLSKLSNLHVIARNSSFAYKGQAVSIPDVAAELGVRYVLEGSVRKAGNRVRVTAQLIDATTGGHIWADRFDRDLTDIFAVQDELTREIVTALKLRLTVDDKDRLTHKIAVDIEAYNLFLRGREHTWAHTRNGNIEGRKLLERALEIEPGYAAAQARIAFSLVIDYANGWSDDPERTLRDGLLRAEQAVEDDNDEAQAHFALSAACIWSRDLDRALAEAERCLALMPNSPEGYLTMSHAQIFAGDAAAALETINTYMTLDPHFPDLTLHFLAEAHISLGQYEEAVDALNLRLERNPDSATGHALLASCYGNLGRIEDGRAALVRLNLIDPDFSIERRRQVLPFRNPADFERRLDGMRKAGMDV
jgi:adenylate cyclase